MVAHRQRIRKLITFPSRFSRRQTERVAQVEGEIPVQKPARHYTEGEGCDAARQGFGIKVCQGLKNRSQTPMHADRAEANDLQADAQRKFTQGLARKVKQVRRRMNLTPPQTLQPRQDGAEIAGREEQMAARLQQFRATLNDVVGVG